jgi:hypothetical protein
MDRKTIALGRETGQSARAARSYFHEASRSGVYPAQEPEGDDDDGESVSLAVAYWRRGPPSNDSGGIPL